MSERTSGSRRPAWPATVILVGLATAVGSLATGGCSIFQPPIERRIEKNQGIFDSFPPEVQQNLRLGKIEIGYGDDMVRIGLGHPDRSYLRREAAGETMIWVYLGQSVRSRSHQTTFDLPVFDPQGHRIIRREELRFDLDEYHEHVKTRVEFADGKVKALEQLSD